MYVETFSWLFRPFQVNRYHCSLSLYPFSLSLIFPLDWIKSYRLSKAHTSTRSAHSPEMFRFVVVSWAASLSRIRWPVRSSSDVTICTTFASTIVLRRDTKISQFTAVQPSGNVALAKLADFSVYSFPTTSSFSWKIAPNWEYMGLLFEFGTANPELFSDSSLAIAKLERYFDNLFLELRFTVCTNSTHTYSQIFFNNNSTYWLLLKQDDESFLSRWSA